jgi:hypothetical protein
MCAQLAQRTFEILVCVAGIIALSRFRIAKYTVVYSDAVRKE